MTISVIIPIYNVEKYLRHCIDSVLAQKYPNLEVILIEDGSPDRCGEICNTYADRDPRIKVIHKDNGGLSDARNTGVSFATGDYVIFLDGDDYWDDPTALCRLASRLKQTGADVLNYSYKKFFEDTGKYAPYFWQLPPMPLLNTKAEQLRYLTDNGLYIASACNKLIRRELLENLRFQEGVYSEDIVWCARLMEKASSMDFVCENFYCYRQRSDSIRHTINDKKCNDLASNILSCLHLADSAMPEIKESLLHYTAFQFGTFFVAQAQAEKPQCQCIEKLAGHFRVLKYHGRNKKLCVLYWACRLIGYKNVCRLVRAMYRR